jgi:hypothetical protein
VAYLVQTPTSPWVSSSKQFPHACSLREQTQNCDDRFWPLLKDEDHIFPIAQLAFSRPIASVRTVRSRPSPKPTQRPPPKPMRSDPSGVADLVGNFEDTDDDEAARQSAPRLDYTTSAPERELNDVPTSFDGWEEDTDSLFALQNSHFQVGTRAFPVIPAGPLHYARPLQSTPRRKPTPKPSDKTFAAPPFSVTEDLSSPSSHGTVMSLPYITASRRRANMRRLGTDQ